MPFLTVLGDGTWRYRRVQYSAGIHEIDEATADAAKRSGIQSLHVSATPPQLARRAPGPLGMADVRSGIGEGVTLAAAPPLPYEEPVVPEEITVPAEFPCLIVGCEFESPYGFPSAPALARHVQVNHQASG